MLSVGDFAKLSRSTKQTLYYYDKKGLLSPEIRDENNKYRFYSVKQLAVCNTIRILQKLGVPLTEIKTLLVWRTPDLAEDILLRQIGDLGEKQRQIAQAQMLLHITLQSLRSGQRIDENIINVQHFPAQKIVIGEQNDYSDGKTDYDALYTFYQTVSEKYPLSEYDTCYPVWGIMSEKHIKKGEWGYPDRYYFFNPMGKDERPAAMYAVGHTRSGYGGGADLFKRMYTYIEQNGYEICGDAYEEYPHNEIGIPDEGNYLVRILITVRKK